MSAKLNITTARKGLRWSLPLMIALLPGVATRAQINNSAGIQAASGINSLGTKVGDGDSQTLGGSCNSGHCRISGGTASGSNLFHRLSKLRTNNNIDKITLDNLIPGSKSNAFRSIILSNVDGNGTYINTPFQLDASSSDLVILSPGGIEIGGLAQFSNIGSLALSTAENLSIGGKIFHYQNSTATDLVNMSAVIDLAQSAFSHNQTQGGEISIKVGELLSIDADLILHSVGGVNIDSASNAAEGNLEAGGSIDLVAHGKSTVANEPVNTANISGISINADSIKIEARGSANAYNAISIDDSSLTTQGRIILNGKAKSTDPSSADYAETVGVSISNTDLSASEGQIEINGVGGSGDTLLLSSGVIIAGSNLRASSISIKGEGGTATSVESSDTSVGVVLYDGTTLDTNSSNDNQGSIIISTENNLLNGNISITGNGGTGALESGGIYSTAVIDSAGSINISGTGGTGQNDIYGVVAEQEIGNSVDSNETLKAEKQITIQGTGGLGVDINDSTGVLLKEISVKAEEGIRIKGTGGGNPDLEGEDTFVTETVGVNISNTDLNASKGQININGVGGSGDTVLLSSGIIAAGSNLRASSVNIKGEGGTATSLESSDTSIGVVIDDGTTLDTNSSNDNQGSIIISTENNLLNGNISITGNGGTGALESGGIYSTAVIDSAGSINISGTGGTGQNDIYGVMAEQENGDSVDLNENLKAEKQITIEGTGGQGVEINNSTGVLLEEISVEAEEGIKIEGTGGGSTDPEGQDAFLDGVMIVNTTLEVNQDSALTDSNNPNNANIIISGKPGRPGYRAEASSGIFLENSEILTEGGIALTGDGRGVESAILEYGNGIYLEGTDLTASSVVLKGYGASATQTDAVDDTGDLINQKSLGVELVDSDIVSKRLNNELDGSIELIGLGGSGNIDINGIGIDDSTLISDTSIQFEGVAGSASTTITDGVGIALDSTSLGAKTIDLRGVGGSGTGAFGANGLSISKSTLDGSNSLTLEGQGGKTTSITEQAVNSDGISLVDQSSLQSKGLIKVIATGGTAAGESDASYGLFLEGSTIKTDADIEIMGSGGTGTEVAATNGVGIYTTFVDDDPYGDIQYQTAITAGENLTISGTGGTATIRASETQGVDLSSAMLKAGENIKVKGVGGTSEQNPDTAGSNQGLYLVGTNIDTSGGNITLTGEGGNGGYLITGVELYDTLITSAKDMNVEGNGGSGNNVNFAEGIYSLYATIESKAGDIKISGKGGTGSVVEDGHGIYLSNNDIALSDNNKLSMQGTGSEASNQIDSNTNTGITLEGTLINGGSSLTLTGTGGTGGKFNTGLEILETDIVATEGVMTLEGTGGKGTNIKAAIGIQIGDESAGSSLVAKSIEITGSGGTSTLKEGAINKDGEDTFQETANNVGVAIDNSSLVSTDKPLSILDNAGNSLASSSGNISILGTGGNLSTDEITNPDSNEDIEKIGKASFLQGINISTSTINSNDAILISGEAGKPIAGNDNSGTSIKQSTLTSATVVATDRSIDNRIEGKAYSGTNNNYGLSIKATDIVSTNQDLDLSGRGGLKATGENNFGIYIGETSSVTVGSSSNPSILNIFGAGGSGTNLTGGILTDNTKYKVEGSIKMYGESQGAGGFGDASVEFFQNVDIIVSDDISIGGNNDININDTTINAGGTTTIDGLGDINISETNITSGENTNIQAGGSIAIADTNIDSGQDTNIQAQGTIAIATSQLNATNDINLQAKSISTMDVEFNSQEISTISNSVLEGNSSSTNDQLTLSLSGNVNYTPEEQSSASTNASDEATKSGKTDETNESAGKQQQTSESNTNVASSTKLTAKAIQESHDKSEKMSTDFVASKLGLKRQAPLSIQEVQKMLTSGQRIMNTSR